MKNSIEKNVRFIKQVFSDVKNNIQGASKYPLGEDFYNFDIADEVINTTEVSKKVIPIK